MGNQTQYLVEYSVRDTKDNAWQNIVYETPNPMPGGVWCTGYQSQCLVVYGVQDTKHNTW